MDDSDQEGFHEAPEEFTYLTIKNINPISLPSLQPLNIFPISLLYELQLKQYPRFIDHYKVAPTNHNNPPSHGQPLALVRKKEGASRFLSDFFPRKLHCVYNKFGQTLLKPDMTSIIRSVGKRIIDNQLGNFKQKQANEITSIQKLQFSSEFQGGNLHCVFKCKKTGVYYLFISNDINTHGYNIWFHFNAKAATAAHIQFVIVNMSRPIKFFQDIYLPIYTSLGQCYERNVKVDCVQSCFKNCQNNKNYYCMQFDYTFGKGQSIYCSLTPPYSYSKLLLFITNIKLSQKQIQLKVDIVGKSQLGNQIPCAIISHSQCTTHRAVIITARQHPCETVSSFICEQIIRLLTSNYQFSLDILLNYTVYVIPMLNPDGVIHGNSRTNILGYDINRTWETFYQQKSIQCKVVWEYIERISLQKDIQWVFDLHGHSKKLGFFCFFSQQNDQSLIYNHYLTSNSKYYMSQDCTFGVSSSKKGSLRGQLYAKMKIRQSVTIETSYYGYFNDNNQFQHWSQRQYSYIASAILKGVFETQKIIKNNKLKTKMIQEIASLEIINKRKRKQKQEQLFSDSDPEDCYLRSQEREQSYLEQARKMIDRSYCPKETAKYTSKTLKKYILVTQQSESKEIATVYQDRFQQQKVHLPVKLNKKLAKNQDQYRHISISTFHNVEVEQKRRARQTIFRQFRQPKLPRKVYSEHRYLINSTQKFQLPRKGSIKKMMQSRNSSHLSSHSMRSHGVQQLEEGSLKHTNSIKLQTVLYPTSHFAEFSLKSQLINLKAKAQQFRDPDRRDRQMSTFGGAFKLRRSIKK